MKRISDRTLIRIAVATFSLAVVLFGVAAAFTTVHGWGSGDRYMLVIIGVWSLVALVLTVKVPRNPIGWLFLAAVLAYSIMGAFGHYGTYGLETRPGSLPAALTVYWISTLTWVIFVIVVPVLALLLFPDGRLPSPRWRYVAWAGWLGIVLAAVASAFEPWSSEGAGGAHGPAGMDNPLANQALADRLLIGVGALVIPVIFAGAASLVVRYRRAAGMERRQLKWVAYGGVLSVGIYTAGGFLNHLPGSWVLVLAAMVIFPATILVAVLRFRLYEIDRLISRTLSYVALTAVLGVVYAVGAIGLGSLVKDATGGRGGELVIAASTLAVAAVFGPARRRIQSVVDRRFNRARYDAARTIDAFGQRLRDQVDLETLTAELRAVAGTALEPSSASILLVGDGVGR